MNFHSLCFAPKCIELVTMSWNIQQSQTVPKSQWLNTTRRFFPACSPGLGRATGGSAHHSHAGTRPREGPSQLVLGPSGSSAGRMCVSHWLWELLPEITRIYFRSYFFGHNKPHTQPYLTSEGTRRGHPTS